MPALLATAGGGQGVGDVSLVVSPDGDLINQ